ncbi:MAG: outer membrane beta-barrel protein [Bacteroidaceae bacterium]|nr:outer membrane beta-barrel protein [Bacteroidaceae bacterium]
MTTSVSAKIGEHHTNRAVLSKSSSYTENYVAKPLQKINESADDSKHGRNHQYNVELDATCEMDSLNLLCMSGQFDENRSKQWVNATYNMEENFSYNIERYIRNHNQNATFSTDYQHFFRKNRNASLTVSYLFNNVVDTHLQEENYWNIEGDVPTISLDTTTVGKTYFITNRIPITIKEHTFQTDFSTAFKHQDLDVGVKYINRNRQQKDVFKNIEQIFRFYAEYTLSLNKWQIKPRIYCDHETSKIDHYERNFNLFQPHLTLSYQIRDNLKFMIEGGYKEFSPDIYALNPFQERYSNRVKYGNPDLNNESNVGGAFSLQYFSQKIYALVGGNVYHTGNSIELYSWTDNGGIINSTYGNVGHVDGGGLDAYICGNLWKNTYITINPRASFKYDRCPIIGVDHKKLALQYTFTLQQKMPLGLSLCLMIDGSTSDIGMMTKTSGYLDHSFSLYRNFLKNDALSVGLIFNDPFKKYHETETETFSSNYYCQEKRRNNVQFFGIDINYHFGKLQNAVKKTKKSIINNDVKVL